MTGFRPSCTKLKLCEARTVLVNGRRINSCLSLAVAHAGDKITTIQIHPMQAAFIEHDGFQWGYCTPGQICSAVAMLDEAKMQAVELITLQRFRGRIRRSL